MPLRKLRRVNRGLLWIVGTPDCGTPCMDCRDHLARVQIMRRTNRDGSCDALDVAEHALLVCAAVVGGWSRKSAEKSV